MSEKPEGGRGKGQFGLSQAAGEKWRPAHMAPSWQGMNAHLGTPPESEISGRAERRRPSD